MVCDFPRGEITVGYSREDNQSNMIVILRKNAETTVAYLIAFKKFRISLKM